MTYSACANAALTGGKVDAESPCLDLALSLMALPLRHGKGPCPMRPFTSSRRKNRYGAPASADKIEEQLPIGRFYSSLGMADSKMKTIWNLSSYILTSTPRRWIFASAAS